MIEICTGCPKGCALDNLGCGRGVALMAGGPELGAQDHGHGHGRDGSGIDFDTKLYKKIKRCAGLLEARTECGALPKELFYDLTQAEKEDLMHAVSKLLSSF